MDTPIKPRWTVEPTKPLCFAAVFFWLTLMNVCQGDERFTNTWMAAIPEEVGLDSASLVEMFEFIREHAIPVHSIQIVRHGRLALDAYFYPYSDQMRHDVASVTKSVTSTLVGLAIDKGFLPNVKEPLLNLFKDRVEARLDSRKKKMTLEHLLTMQAGWDCGFEPNEARLFEMRRSMDWTRFMLDLPMVADPGTRWAYCSGNCHLLSVILTQVTKTNALAFARRELFAPLGIQNIAWAADELGNNHGWGDLQLHPRDMARLGQLFLQRGRWNKSRILSENWVQVSTQAHVERTSNADHYGYYWWVKGEKFPGMFEAVGRGGQRINVWPSKDLVLVFTGGGFEPGDLASFILKSLKSDNSLPSNSEAYANLKQRLLAARNAPTPRQAANLPETASQISRRMFRLSENSLKLSSIALEFENPAEAKVQLTWEGNKMNFLVGLDGVERFSANPLTHLPQAAKGHWIDRATFHFELNLVGGINNYLIKLTFLEGGKKVVVALTERTGLNNEHFEGVANE